MQKIVYYENILEFKKNTKSNLLQSEVNDWQLCRTCLCDTGADCSELHKMCIMGTDGNLLNVHEMLTIATGLEFHETDKLPQKMCKDCLNKLSTFYFFKLQTKRAETVLKSLLLKLDETSDYNASEFPAEQPTVETSIEEVYTTSSLSHDNEHAQDYDSAIEQIMEEDPNNSLSMAIIEVQDGEVCVENDVCNKSNSQQYDDNQEQEKQEPFMAVDGEELLVENMNYFVHKLEEDDVEVEVDYLEVEEEKVVEQNVTKTEEVIEPMEEEEYLDNDESSNITEDNSGVIVLNLEDVQNIEVLEENDTISEDPHESDMKLGFHRTDDENEMFVSNSTVEEPKQKKQKQSNLDNLNCSICNMAFPKQCLLVSHVQDLHPNTKAFKCRECGTMFSHLQSLSRHMISHKSVQFRNICDLCGKAFLRSDDWRRHLRVHTGERPYPCNTCGKAFKQTNELKEHTLTHVKAKLFECNICGHRMSSRNGLYIHRKAHTGIKNFVCPHCEKRFLTGGELKSHINVHLKKARLEE